MEHDGTRLPGSVHLNTQESVIINDTRKEGEPGNEANRYHPCIHIHVHKQ